MLLQKNDKIRGLNAYFLLIGIISLFFCLFPVQENTNNDTTFTAENILQENTSDDLKVSYFFLRSKPSKRFFKHIARCYASFITLKNDIFSQQVTKDDTFIWQKPRYYQFLFRYTLF